MTRTGRGVAGRVYLTFSWSSNAVLPSCSREGEGRGLRAGVLGSPQS